MLPYVLAVILLVFVLAAMYCVHIWTQTLLSIIIDLTDRAHAERQNLLNRIQTGSAEKARVLEKPPEPPPTNIPIRATLGTATVGIVPEKE
jgi:uncharacterized membrane protein